VENDTLQSMCILSSVCGVRRYYTAEGVRIYSQETWNEVTEGRGKQLVEQHIDVVVQLSVSCLFF